MKRPTVLLAISLVFVSCTSVTNDEGASKNPGKPVTFSSAAARTGTKTIRLEGVEYGSGSFGVVFAHERPASQDAWTEIAREAASNGFHALTFNFRGYGVSEGSQSELGLIDLDIEAAIRYIRSAGATRIVLVGGSMGGTAALVVTPRATVQGVVTLSAPATFMGLDATAAVRTIERDVEILYIAGADDHPYVDDARALFALARSKQDLDIVPGEKAHASELLRGKNGKRSRQRIMEFLTARRAEKE